jgi:TRAP transporter 4TM/12TM fusion protein
MTMRARLLTVKNFNLVSIIAIAMAFFHLYTSGFGRLPGLQQRAVHLLFALVLTFYIYPFKKKKGRYDSILNLIFSIGALLACGNIIFVIYYVMYERAGAATTIDIWLGSIIIILVLDMTRRIMGWALPIITIIFIAYGFMGPIIPIPYIRHPGLDLSYFVSYQYLGTEGLFTVPLGISATFIAIFVIFASFLTNSGVGDFFMEASSAVAGHRRGGPAKVSVVASAFMGSVSGSAVGNVVTTGSVTIPLMKKMGFPPQLAAGIEAIASTGGQIMPPIMGAGAFVMAGIIGKPYLIVCLAAVVPALLYFLSVFVMVHFESERYGIEGLPKESLPHLLPVLKKRGHLMLPLGVLIFMLLTGATAMKAGFFAVISVIAISAIQKETRMGFLDMLNALESGAKGILPIAAACACSGIVVGVLTITGLGLKMSFLLVQISQGVLPVLLMLSMVAAILLGMGITTTAAYLLVAIIVAPALTKMGIPELAAHLFVFYYAVISTITPPVALAAYAAAGVAESDPFKTALVGFKIGIAAYVIPFYIIYTPGMMLVSGEPLTIIWAVITAFFGIWALSGASCGYLFRKLKIHERLLLFISVPLTIPHILIANISGLTIISVLTYLFWINCREKKNVLQAKDRK